jgi:hypothetical protein
MDTKYDIRRIRKSDFEFIYNSLCDLENEILEPALFEKIFN